MTKDFAVIKLNSSQLIVEEGTRFKADSVSDSTKVDILLAEIDGKTLIGTPFVDGIGVKLNIIDEGKDKKLNVGRYKSKSRYRRSKGHRQPVSYIEVAKLGKGVKTEFVKMIVKEVENKLDKSQSKSKNIQEMDLTDSIKEKLIENGYKTVADLKNITKEQLVEIKGIGEKAAEKIISEVK